MSGSHPCAETSAMQNSEITKDRGASMVEYALLVAIIAVLSVPAMAMAGRGTERTMTTVAEALEQPGHGGPVSGVPGDTGNPGNPGGTDDSGNGGDTGNPGNPGGGDDPGNGGNPGNPGGNDDPGNGGGADEGPASTTADWEIGEPSATLEKTASQNHWWTATLPLVNGGTEDLVFKIVVTTVDDDGKTVSKTLEVVVPAGQQLDFKTDDLKMQDHKNKGLNGIMSVLLEVSSVTTAAGDPAPGPSSGTITVDHPPLP